MILESFKHPNSFFNFVDMWTYFILTLYPGIVGGLFGTDSGSVSLFGYPQKLHKHVEKRLQASVNSIRG